MKSSDKRFRSWPRALSTLAFCAMVAVVIVYGQTGGSAQTRARAVVDHLRYDLGTVFAGEQPTHTFVIRNEGTAPLTLVDKKRDIESANQGSARSRSVVAYARAALPASKETAKMPMGRAAEEPVPT